jgi:hypothetical protein
VAKVFICYRREDSAGHAGRVHDRLEREFGRDLLFMDVDAIPPGRNFVKVLHDEVAKCDVLLALIGPSWLAVSDEGGRRLDSTTDFVRIEIAAALQRDVPVIPLLLDGARIPKPADLPADIQELALRSALEIRHASFHQDMDRLVRAIREGTGASPPDAASDGSEVPAEVPSGKPGGGIALTIFGLLILSLLVVMTVSDTPRNDWPLGFGLAALLSAPFLLGGLFLVWRHWRRVRRGR